MSGIAGSAGHRDGGTDGTGGSSDWEYDALVLDAAYKQSLASVRSLGRAGLRVAAAESYTEWHAGLPVPAFRSRYCARAVTVPDCSAGPDALASAVLDFVREHPARVLLPTGDAVIATLAPHRAALARLGCVLAIASDAALAIATDKDRTLDVAAGLGIQGPRTRRIDVLTDLTTVFADFPFPFVLKPAESWPDGASGRLVPADVINAAEATETAGAFLAAGSAVLAQEWASGRREGATLFLADGQVVASCCHVAYRTSPPLGGASVLRESITPPADILQPSVRLAQAIGLEGACEVEFRRNAAGTPLLMEINPRLAGTIENAVQAGVDFPLLIWRWAAGLPLTRAGGYRTGIRTRWLHGDLRWLRDNQRRAGRPDSETSLRALGQFAAEFARTRHYDCFDWGDPRPFLTELRNSAAIILRQRPRPLPEPTPIREGS